MNKQELINALSETGILTPDLNRPGKFALSTIASSKENLIPKIKRLKPRVINITNTTPTVLFAALPGKINIITEFLVMNADGTTGTLVELREENADGALLWKGMAANNGGGFNQPMQTYIEQPTTNKPIVAICLTNAANVVISAAGITN